MEELPLFGRRFSATTKDEKTRAALGIFAHYDKLLLYHSNTKYTHPITASLSLKIALVGVEQLSTSPSPQTYVKPSRFSAFSFNFRPQVRHFLRVIQINLTFWCHFDILYRIARVIHQVMCGGHHDLTLTLVTLQGSTFAIYYADAERSEALANCLLNATRFFLCYQCSL